MGDGGVGEPGGPGNIGGIGPQNISGEMFGGPGAEFQGGPLTGAPIDAGFGNMLLPDTGGSEGSPFPVGQQEGPAQPIEKFKSEPKTEKVDEKKEGVKRKARKRSLLSDEETKVYRRSILGS